MPPQAIAHTQLSNPVVSPKQTYLCNEGATSSIYMTLCIQIADLLPTLHYGATPTALRGHTMPARQQLGHQASGNSTTYTVLYNTC